MDHTEHKLISLLMKEAHITRTLLRGLGRGLERGCVQARKEMIQAVDRIKTHISKHDEEIAWGMCFILMDLGSIVEVHAVAVDHQPVGVSLQLPHHPFSKQHQHEARCEFAAWVAFAHMMHHRMW